MEFMENCDYYFRIQKNRIQKTGEDAQRDIEVLDAACQGYGDEKYTYFDEKECMAENWNIKATKR